MRKILLLAFFFAIFASFQLFAKGGETWLTINTKAGLPSNNLTCLAIFPGKMAVGSDKGVGLFLEDQLVWYNLGNYLEAINGLAIRSIDFDSYGNLWAATPNGVFCIELEEFPAEVPRLNYYGTENGLSTVDTEVLEIVDDILYVGCFGGWLYKTSIFQKGAGTMFTAVNSGGMGHDEEHRIMSVGITAMAMDFPEVGIYSTKGKGLLRADNGKSYVAGAELPSDWVNDFWSFSDNNRGKIIAVTQSRMTLIENYQIKGEARLPIAEDCWISCLTTAPDDETEALNTRLKEEDVTLDEHLGDRLLYVGTKGRGLWKFDEGHWYNYTSRDCPLPSDNINKVYYLPGGKKVAVLTDAGLTLFGLTEDESYDEFEFKGSTPYFAKSFWPFMTQWGPYIYGYPWQKSYPIEPYITYKKLVRGKDLWVLHQRGLSRFVFPAAPFLGVLGFKHMLAGRFENPRGDPSKNNLLEDDSVVLERPPTGPGERVWHHYCREQPQDYSKYALSTIFCSEDMETLAGPMNMLRIEVGAAEDFNPEDHAEAIRNASTSFGMPPVVVLDTPDGLYDTRGHRVSSVASQMIECPLHPIPSTDISDFALDFNERCWAIFEGSWISVLNSTDYSGGLAFGVSHGHEWVDITEQQVPWPKDEKLTCVRQIGGNIYVGTENSGMYLLPTAHAIEPEDVNFESWRHVDTPAEENLPGTSLQVNEIVFWRTNEGEMIALMHEESLSLYDGRTLISIPVPKRRYTCMVADRENQLWLGALDGLLYISPNMKINDILMDGVTFESPRIVTIAAAPDDAKYPFLIALSYDKFFNPGTPGHWKSSDVPPMLSHDDNPYRLRVKNPEIDASKVMLWNGKEWDKWSRPGVHGLMFDQRFLWLATSNRVMRMYLPVEQFVY